MKRLFLAIACVALLGCDGLGRGIVGERTISDGGDDDQCDVTPMCRPLRTFDPGAFTIPAHRLEPVSFADCDEDGVEDAMDNCPGVPNEDQLDVCFEARTSCDRLRAGGTDVAYDDLRGCRIDEPLEVRPGFSLAGAELGCAMLELTAADTQPIALELTQATMTRASLSLASESVWIVDATRVQLRGGFMRLRGGARLRARDAIFSDASVVIEPSGAIGSDPSPAIELTVADVEATTFFEAPSAWPGRVRVERSSVRSTTFSVAVLDLVGPSMIVASSLGASELIALDVELVTSSIRAGYAALSTSRLREVVFAECGDLQIVASELEDVDVPACEPERFRLVDSEAIGVNLAGGVWMIGGYLGASVIGGGPDTGMRTEEAELDAVTICDLGGAAFYGGELRCVKCEEDAFMQGTSVCLGGARIFERGCPAIELAPECP